MKTIVILFMCFPLFSIGQNRICKEIKITHTVEDLYTLPTVPIGCDKDQKHGPIIITDSLEVARIYSLLLESIECHECKFEPDVRIKTEFVFENESSFLCFSDPKDIMTYSGILFKYNTPLCSLIIENIKKTGISIPQFVDPPNLKINNPDCK